MVTDSNTKELTVEEFDKIPDGDVFRTGTLPDSPEGLNMTNSGRMLKWIAKKGYANDWAIYCHWADSSDVYVRQHGQKVASESNILNAVPCVKEVLNRYRY